MHLVSLFTGCGCIIVETCWVAVQLWSSLLSLLLSNFPPHLLLLTTLHFSCLTFSRAVLHYFVLYLYKYIYSACRFCFNCFLLIPTWTSPLHSFALLFSHLSRLHVAFLILTTLFLNLLLVRYCRHRFRNLSAVNKKKNGEMDRRKSEENTVKWWEGDDVWEGRG